MRFGVALGAVLAGILTSGGSAVAQDVSLLAPEMDSEFTAPRYFEGLYAGIGFATLGGNKNFWAGEELAYGGGVSVGYGHYLTDTITLGGEIQAAAGMDTVGNVRYDVLAMAHLGALHGPYFRTYLAAGAGWFHSASAWAAGVGAEWALRDNLSLHAEFLAIGQIGQSSTGVSISGISGNHIKAGVIWHFGDKPVDSDAAFLPASEATDFDGFYTSVLTGLFQNPTHNILGNTGTGWHQSRGSLGVAAGYNHAVLPGILAGVEAQTSVLFNSSGDIQNDGFLLGRLGGVPFDGLFIYGQGGVGFVVGKPAYALGAGAEWAAWGDSALRLDVVAIGELSPATAAASGITAYKATIGPTWHFD